MNEDLFITRYAKKFDSSCILDTDTGGTQIYAGDVVTFHDKEMKRIHLIFPNGHICNQRGTIIKTIEGNEKRITLPARVFNTRITMIWL